MEAIERIRQKTNAIIAKKKSLSRKEYQHSYYLAHKEQILESRRKKYKERKQNGSKIVGSEV